MAANKYDEGLARNSANYAPLSPLTFLRRAAAVFPDRIAIIHGDRRTTYRDFYRRCRQLASALKQAGVSKGDTVAIMAPNIPAMLEAHYGVPMLGAVLNTLNTRLDAKAIAFTLDHGEAKFLLTDREYSTTIGAAIADLPAPPRVIDIDDHLAVDGRLIGETDYESFIAAGVSGFRMGPASGRMGRYFAQLHVRNNRKPKRGRLSSSRRLPPCHRQYPRVAHARASCVPLDAADVPLQRLVFYLVAEH